MLLKGKQVADAIDENILENIDKLYVNNIVPTLAVFRIGENPSDIAYENSAIKKANKLGFKVEKYTCKEDIDQEDVIDIINIINDDENIHGVLMLRPFPKAIDDDKVRNALDTAKDIDGITDESLVGVFTDNEKGYPPCTAEAAVRILEYYNKDLNGSKIAVLGRSLVIGKPVSMLLMKKNATVTVCHSKTKEADALDICKSSDIIVTAVGKLNSLTADNIKEGQTIIDVGINFNSEGKMVGDVNLSQEEIEKLDITPVPGGVGSVTTSILMEHVFKSAMKKINN